MLESGSSLSERQLLRALGMSLSKTGYYMPAVLIKFQDCRDSGDKPGYAYLPTRAGIAAWLPKIKGKGYESLKTRITELRREVQWSEAWG